MTKKNIGKRLRAWRKERGWKENELGLVIGLSQGSLSTIETGKSYPSTPTIIKLMTRTDIDVRWLLLGNKKIGYLTFYWDKPLINEFLYSQYLVSDDTGKWENVHLENK